MGATRTDFLSRARRWIVAAGLGFLAGILACVLGGLAGSFLDLWPRVITSFPDFWSKAGDWIIVAGLGFLVGMSDLLSRYRDAPTAVLRTVPALVYQAINAIASVAALLAARGFGWISTNPSVTSNESHWLQILAAGLGAMALLRTSLTFRAGDRAVSIGLSTILEVILNSVDSSVDRVRGRSRDRVIRRVMRGISFDRAYEALPAYCIALMQRLPPADQKRLTDSIAAIATRKSPGFPDSIRARLLGLEIMNVMGEGILAAAVESLQEEVKAGGTPPPAPGTAASAKSATGQPTGAMLAAAVESLRAGGASPPASNSESVAEQPAASPADSVSGNGHATSSPSVAPKQEVVPPLAEQAVPPETSSSDAVGQKADSPPVTTQPMPPRNKGEDGSGDPVV